MKDSCLFFYSFTITISIVTSLTIYVFLCILIFAQEVFNALIYSIVIRSRRPCKRNEATRRDVQHVKPEKPVKKNSKRGKEVFLKRIYTGELGAVTRCT